VTSPAGDRKAVVFSVGGVRLALRLSQVREILSVPGEDGVRVRGAPVPALPVAVALGTAAGEGRFALVLEASPPAAIRVDALHGIVDVADAEAFQLPSLTLLPQPPPFQGALVVRGDVALELSTNALGWAPLEPAADPAVALAELDLPAPAELLFSRGGRTFAVPLPLLVRVVDDLAIHPVPLTPRSHLGLAYHGHALHPVFDPAALYGEPAGAPAAANVLLVDAGGAQVGLAADAIVGSVAPRGGVVARPSWDALFAG
jgi:chemotaxis signal transduction protein